MKTCNKCGETKALTEFSKHKRTRDGLETQCKNCRNIIQKAYCKANPEKEKARHKTYSKTNPEKIKAYKKAYHQTPAGKISQYKSDAKKRNIPFLLTEEEFKGFWQAPCTYCGAAIETIGLDRVDSSGPYHIDNVVSCCRPCNSSKNSKTLEEWQGREND